VPDPATTKRTLTRLARRPVDRIAAEAVGSDASYRTVIDTADSASQRLEDAAAFVEAGGLDRLDDAIDTAVEHGDHAAARRGRRVRASVEAFRVAASGESVDESDDHFHSGRGTHLGSGDQAGSK
jgi:hypothetical protein